MFKSFINWQHGMISETEDDTVVLCPTCEGEGVVITECDCCGSEKEEECHLCESSGKVVFGELDFNDQKRCYTRREYNTQLAYDVIKLANWLGSPLGVVRYGFAIGSYRNFPRSEVVINIKSGWIIGSL